MFWVNTQFCSFFDMFFYSDIARFYEAFVFFDFSIYEFIKMNSCYIARKLQTREFDKSIQCISHTVECMDTFFYQTFILFFGIAENLEISRDDGEGSLELMARIMDEVIHCIHIIPNRGESLSYEVSPHQIKREKDDKVHNEKPEDISENILDGIS